MTLAENVALPIGEVHEAVGGRDPHSRVHEARARGAQRASRTSTRRRSQAACGSAPDSRARWRSTPTSCSSTSRRRARRSASRLLDDLILALRDSLGSTVVVVTHELASIFTIADDSGVPRRRHAHHDRARQPEGARRALSRRESAALPHAQRQAVGASGMKKRVSPTLIGAFVLGALALVVGGIVALGSMSLLQHRLSVRAVLRGLGGRPRAGRARQVQRRADRHRRADPARSGDEGSEAPHRRRDRARRDAYPQPERARGALLRRRGEPGDPRTACAARSPRRACSRAALRARSTTTPTRHRRAICPTTLGYQQIPTVPSRVEQVAQTANDIFKRSFRRWTGRGSSTRSTRPWTGCATSSPTKQTQDVTRQLNETLEKACATSPGPWTRVEPLAKNVDDLSKNMKESLAKIDRVTSELGNLLQHDSPFTYDVSCTLRLSSSRQRARSASSPTRSTRTRTR